MSAPEYFILEHCPIENAQPFFEGHLSHSMEDYPGGIVIPIDKPYRWTSADVVRKVKFILQKHFAAKKLKVGHAGTLDPLATGLLIICVGKATKIAEQLQAHEKEYLATVEFGATTSSFDLEQPIDKLYPFEHITRQSVENILHSFVGEQDQVPPVFSAKVVGGLRAYEYARAGESVELKTNRITIKELELLAFHEAGTDAEVETEASTPKEDLSAVRNIHNYHVSGASDGKRPTADIRIRCSKGTYIRSLARDIGLSLESGAYLTGLRRVASGIFRLE